MKHYKVETLKLGCGIIAIENKKVIKKGTAQIYTKYIGKTFESTKKLLLKKYENIKIQEL